MSERNYQRYIDAVDSLNGTFILGYDAQTQRLHLGKRKGRVSGIDGMLLDEWNDYIVTCNFFDGDFSMGVGFDISGRLFQANSEELNKIISRTQEGGRYSSHSKKIAAEKAKNDILSLKRAETEIYRLGLILPNTKTNLELI